MSPKLLMLLFVGATNVVLALIVYLKNRGQLVNQLFTVFASCMAVWALGDYLVHTYVDTRSGLLWGRMTFAAASLVPLSFLTFSEVFPNGRSLSMRKELLIFGFLGISFTLLSLSPLIVVDNIIVGKGEIKPQYGPAYPFFAIYFLSCLSYAFFILAKKWRQLQGIAKLQVQYLFLGMFLAGCAGTITNLIIPLLFHSSRFSAYGPSFSIIMVGMIAHAIVRYRLMNIKLVIKRGLVYAVSAILVAGCVVAVTYLLEPAFGHRLPYLSFTFAGLVALCLTLAFQPLKSIVQSLADRYFYREPYDYHRTLQEASRTLTSVLDLDSLFKYIVAKVEQTMRTEWVYLFSFDEKAGGFQQKMGEVTVEAPLVPSFLSDGWVLVRTLKQGGEALVREEIQRHPLSEEMASVQTELGRIRCDVALPMLVKGDLVGVLLIGPKLSGDPYFQGDLDLLSTICNQAAVAIRNAQLYQEVIWAKEYIENILENMESGVVTVDREGKITVFNRAAERMTGLPAQEVVGKPIDVLGSDFSEPVTVALSKRRLYSHFEGVLSNERGGSIPIVFSTSLLHDQQDKEAGAIMVFSDLSQIKMLEEERNRAQRLASVGALAADLSHEIRTPLVAIKTFAELLPVRFSDAEFRGSFLKVVTGEIGRIDSLVSQLSTLARESPSKLELVDLHPPLDDVLTLLSAQLDKQRVQVVRDYSDDLPPLWADETQLKQLFLNLLKNSMEAMPEGGVVKITTSYREDKGSGQGALEVRISDTGRGAPEGSLEKLFDPFFTTKEKGMGLGLTICHRIVQGHRGSLVMENNKDGPGVTVSVYLPTSAQKEEMGLT